MAEERTLIIHAGMHKTGSSAIQNYLYRSLDLPDYEYFSAGMANASLVVREAFHSRLAQLPAYKSMQVSDWRLASIRKRARKRFLEALKATTKQNVILSAESISLLDKKECADLRDTVSPYFQQVKLVLYIRPLRSRAQSAFQERLKTRYTPLDHPVVVNFKRTVSIFDEVFGPENVTVRRYLRSDFPEGSIIRDFLSLLAVDMRSIEDQQANESLSLPAVQLLYVYRKFYPDNSREDSALVARLSSLGGDRFRMHSQLLDRIIVEQGSSVDWLKNRTGISLGEDAPASEGPVVKAESDLLNVSSSTLEWLGSQGSGPTFRRLDAGDLQGIANALRALALSLGKNSGG